MAVDTNRLDDAARAGWLYHVAGNTHAQIAAKLGVSRQSAQRLVALGDGRRAGQGAHRRPHRAVPGAFRDLTAAFNLSFCEVVPSDPESESTTLGVAIATASNSKMARQADADDHRHGDRAHAESRGRATTGERLPAAQGGVADGKHSADGSAAFYNVVFTMADKVHRGRFRCRCRSSPRRGMSGKRCTTKR